MRRLCLREGWAVETVARRFGVHHSTVRRAISVTSEAAQPRPAGVLEPFKPYLVQRLTEAPELTGTRLLAELKAQGYQHGIAILRRYVAKVRHPRPRKVYLRVETEPGEYAQVDWGSFGHFRIGSTSRPLSAFAMVLSYSRALFVDFSLDMHMETFLRMHQRALEYFGGIPRRILYDNLKSVVLNRVGSTVQFNPRFLSFAGHYLFEPTAAPIRYPEAKGRVEACIKYLRHAFFYGRSFSSLEDLRAQARTWLAETANTRLHATTRERPCERLLLEKPRLHPLPAHPYDTDVLLPLVVSKEARVRLDSNSYSVPPEFAGKSVHLRANDTSVRILHEGTEVARHERCWDRHRHIEDAHHIQRLLERRKLALGPKRKERLASLSPEARLYLQEVARRPIRLNNECRALLRLTLQYSDAEVAAAMARALVLRTFGARYVRALIDQARFAQGLAEPPEPILTGNAIADSLDVQPHPLDSYDALPPQKPNLRLPS
ncbi:IS21 family transposase [Myxococcus sp. K15C18031901]|uniref:IS21 family transposase n=1 Tax=Myxococcus dinghuensis TaxID=2906761 RepID=UPI0020A76AA6|nr:IS21 family transposase [Myxococcus dinghuensis]MCP3105549.1 IS21 family transposase [Myxococcus dinghuensis]